LCTKRFQNFPAIQVAWDSNFTNTHKSHVQLKTIERNYELDGESTNALIEKQKTDIQILYFQVLLDVTLWKPKPHSPGVLPLEIAGSPSPCRQMCMNPIFSELFMKPYKL
jgi:hypothetical protein